MTAPVRRSDDAEQDLIEHYVYYGEREGAPLAERFLAAAEATIAMIALHPAIGAARVLGGLPGLRVFPVRGFESVLVFYLVEDGGVVVLRVLHGARNLPDLFRS